MILVIDAIFLKNRGKLSEMFKRLVPQNQDLHPVTLASAQVKYFRKPVDMDI